LETGSRQYIRVTTSRFSALGLRALIFAALSAALIVADYSGVGLSSVRNVLKYAASPLQWIVQIPSAAIDLINTQIATRETLIRENQSLKSNLTERETALLRFKSVQDENDRLRELLSIKKDERSAEVGAMILSVKQDHLRQRVLIDQGSDAGIGRDQPVIDRGGVYGQTVSVGPTTSEVILLSDSGHAIPVIIERTGLRSIAVGTGDPHELLLPYLPRNTDVEKNDRILTSGLGGIFKAGLPVGIVKDVKRDPSQPLARILVEPAAALDRSHEVLVLEAAPIPREPAPANAPSATNAPARPTKVAKP